MKKTKIILSIFLLILITIIPIGCNKESNHGEQTNINRPEYLEDTLSLVKYKNYLSITSTYTSKTNAFNSYILDVTYNVTITPQDSALIFENCNLVIEGKTITLQSTGTTNYQFSTTKSSFSTSLTLREPSSISGKVKRPNDGTYKIYYVDSNDNIVNTDIITQGKSLTSSYIPNNLTGYNFIAWSLTSHYGLESTYVQYPYTPSKDTWLYSIVQGIEIPVTLISDGIISTTNINYGASYNLSVPTKDNYKFVGWFDTISGKGTQYTNANGSSINICEFVNPITLYARWEIKKTDREWDNAYYYSLEYYNIKNAKVTYYSPNYFFIDAEPETTYKITTSTNYMNMSSYVSIRIAGAMGALLEGGSFINYSFGNDFNSCPTFTFEVSQAGRYYITVLGYGLQSTPNLEYIYNISSQIIY